MPIGGRIVQPSRKPPELRGEHQPDTDGGAVPPPVAFPSLDGMPQRVPVVENLPRAVLPQIAADDTGLHTDSTFHEFPQYFSPGVQCSARVRLDQFENPCV